MKKSTAQFRTKRRDGLGQCSDLTAELKRMTDFGATLLYGRNVPLSQDDADQFHERIQAVKTAVRNAFARIEADLRALEKAGGRDRT